MITQINASEIIGYPRITKVLLTHIQHINDIPANPIFDNIIILEHIIELVDIAMVNTTSKHLI